MKNYRVTVNGIAYDVVVEEIGAGTAPAAPVSPVAAPAAAPAPAAKPAGPAGANAIKAPMPGNVIKMNVKAGDAVKKGDVLCVLEAMKMENDITAPKDGVIASVDVQQGATVVTDTLLLTMN